MSAHVRGFVGGAVFTIAFLLLAGVVRVLSKKHLVRDPERARREAVAVLVLLTFASGFAIEAMYQGIAALS